MLSIMSEEVQLGKDKIIFVTEEDHAKPSTIQLPEPEEPPGLILEDGSINWNCPCLGGMATGPCGVPFREAFSCFHNSTADIKGSDCVEAFTAMQSCMQKYPALYGPNENDEEDSPKIPLGPLEDTNSDSPTPEGGGDTVKLNN